MEQNEILNTTPVEIVAGTTVEWSLNLSHKPTDGYVCKFRLAGAASAVTITATQVNESYALRLIPANTSAFATGVYFYQITTEKAGDIFPEIEGEIRINALVGSAGYDGRSVAEKIVDAIDALVLSRATIDQQSYQIGNRQLSRIPFEHLPATRKYYAAIVDQERRAQRIQQGKSPYTTIKFRFSRD